MPTRSRELQVVRGTFQTQHHAIESLVIFKMIQLDESQSFAVKPDDLFEIVGRTRNT